MSYEYDSKDASRKATKTEEHRKMSQSWMRAPINTEGVGFLAATVAVTASVTIAVGNWVDDRVDDRIDSALVSELAELRHEQERIRIRLDSLSEEVKND